MCGVDSEKLFCFIGTMKQKTLRGMRTRANGRCRERPRSAQESVSGLFITVAEAFGFTEENAGRFTAFATTEQRLHWHLHGEKRPMYVYENENGEIIGYYSLLFQENNECELNNLCVAPESRHGKVGEALLLHSYEIAKAAGCVKMNIGIVEENVQLRKWYEKYGVVHQGTKKFDFFPFTCGYMERML